MNFYKRSLSGKEYSKILDFNFTKKFILENSGMLIGDKALYRQIKIYEILQRTKKVKGDIIEFGIWNGNNLIFIKKIADYFNLKKKIFGFDNFGGFPNPTKLKKSKKGRYTGNPEEIAKVLKFFKLNNIKIFNDDIMNLINYKNQFKKISFIYIDCNIYEPVKIILKQLAKKLSKGGVIAFDEAQHSTDKGEKKALIEFYKKNNKKFVLKFLKKKISTRRIINKKINMFFFKEIIKKNFFLYDFFTKLNLIIFHKNNIRILFYNTRKDLLYNFNILSNIADSKFSYNQISSLFNYKFKEIIFKEIKKKIKKKKIKILEIGTFDAHFTNWLSKLFPEGQIFTIDIDHKSKEFVKLEKKSVSSINTLLKIREKNLKRENIKFIKMNSLDLMKKFKKETFDLIFVDGFHKDPIVSQDIKNSLKLTKLGGFVVIDDLSYSKSNNSSLDGMKALNRLKKIQPKLLLKHVRPQNYNFKSFIGFFEKKN